MIAVEEQAAGVQGTQSQLYSLLSQDASDEFNAINSSKAEAMTTTLLMC